MNLFKQANEKLSQSFYRHTSDVATNKKLLTIFSTSLCKAVPLLDRKPVNTTSVKREFVGYKYKTKGFIFNRELVVTEVYEYTVYLKNSNVNIRSFKTIEEAYKHSNILNQTILDAALV